jgi:hypothetical protein
MSYFIFLKDLNNIEGSIYRIAENQNDLDNMNINKQNYKIIEDTQINFNSVKNNAKLALKYNQDLITYVDQQIYYSKKIHLENYVNILKNQISYFLNTNSNHVLFDRWNNYLSQLNNLNLDNITYPLNKSLEQYFNDLGQPSYNILQLP